MEYYRQAGKGDQSEVRRTVDMEREGKGREGKKKVKLGKKKVKGRGEKGKEGEGSKDGRMRRSVGKVSVL